MSKEYVHLDPLEMIEERPFTNPVDSMQDLATLEYMLERLCEVLKQPQGIPAWPRPFILYLREADNRFHRITIAKLETLLTSDHLMVVGFCGQKRLGADRGPLDAVDEELIAEFPHHPHLLSYSTLQLECGNSCNLVLFDNPKGLKHWATGEKHAYAITLAPGYYATVRLHNAVLPGGLMSGNKLSLMRTKYYDYQDNPFWWAVREM